MVVRLQVLEYKHDALALWLCPFLSPLFKALVDDLFTNLVETDPSYRTHWIVRENSVSYTNQFRENRVGCSERQKEIKRRRKRRVQLVHLKSRLAKSTQSEKVEITRKLRSMTPGAEVLIENWELAKLDR
jgi:hypothetical protein